MIFLSNFVVLKSSNPISPFLDFQSNLLLNNCRIAAERKWSSFVIVTTKCHGFSLSNSKLKFTSDFYFISKDCKVFSEINTLTLKLKSFSAFENDNKKR